MDASISMLRKNKNLNPEIEGMRLKKLERERDLLCSDSQGFVFNCS